MYKELHNYLKSSDFEKASYIVFSDLKHDFVGLIMKKANINNESEALSILTDSLYYVQAKIENGEFVFQNESAFKSYFKKACVYKSLEYKKEMSGNSKLFVSDELLETGSTTCFEENEQEDFDVRFIENQKEEYKKIEKEYGIKLKPNRNDKPMKNIDIFHKFSAKEQVITILRSFFKVPYKEIFGKIGDIYQIKSVDVCKTTYYRCRKKIKF